MVLTRLGCHIHHRPLLLPVCVPPPVALGVQNSRPSRLDAIRMSSDEAKRRFIDIGANLLDQQFQGRYNTGSQKHEPDLDAVIARASQAGVDKLIVTAGSLEGAQQALELVTGKDSLYCTVGVHPTRCTEFSGPDDSGAHGAALQDVLSRGQELGKVVAVGECGLDYDRLQFCDKEQQLRGFELQFELAERSGLPMFFHCRNAAQDFVDVVRRNRGRFKGGVVHSFDGTKEEAQAMIDMGLYIGINGCSLKTADNLEVARSIPSERLMIETDAPWCEVKATHAGAGYVRTKWPTKKKEKFEMGQCVKGRQEPCHISAVFEVVAALQGGDEDALAQQLYQNTCSLFFPDGP